LSFWRVQKDKREPGQEQIVLLEGSKRQKKAGPGANCPFGGLKKAKESRTRSELSFWRAQKDKREPDQEQIVLLESSKRQKRAGPGANCPFGELKKTKESRIRGELSFWRAQKDKRKPDQEQIVFLESSKRQKRSGPGANCLFGELKKTKESRIRGELSFWRAQKDKRKPDQEQIVLLESSKRQKRAVPGANCPFGELKKTKESRTRSKLSFWRVQKDKREPYQEQIVLLEGSKRQKRAVPRANCLFEWLKKTKESQLDKRDETASNMNFNFPLVMSPDKV
jgi:hypothetical protein